MEMLREVDGIHFGPDSATWQAVTEAFIEAAGPVEGIGLMSAITVAASELGTFLDPRNREMIDVLNALWDGQEAPWQRRTKGDGVSEIQNPWLNFLGCTTPGWIEENFPEHAIKGGFTSRTVFVYADRKRELIAYPKLRMDASGAEFRKLRRWLINDLKAIAQIKGEYVLSEAATTWGISWYERHWTQGVSHLDADLHGGYIARKQTHIHKTAMVLAAAETTDLVIEAKHLQQAEQLITSLEFSLPNVFNSIIDNKEAQYSALLVRIVRRHPKGVQKRAVWRTLFSSMSENDFKLACQGAINAGYIREGAKGTDAWFFPVREDDETKTKSA